MNKAISEIKPRDIHRLPGDNRILIAGFSVASQNIAWAIVSACYTRNEWLALTLDEICEHLKISKGMVMHFIDKFFEANGYLEMTGDRYVPTQKFIQACFEAQSAEKAQE